MTRFIKPVLAWWKVDPAVAKTGDYVRLKQHVDNWSGKPIEGRVQEITVGPDDTLVFQVGMVSEVAYPRDIVQVGKPKPGIRDALAQMARQAGFQGETARHERVTVERPARNRLGKSISAYQ